MSESDALPERDISEADPRASVWSRIGVDWWAVIVAGVITVLAVSGALPRIGW